MTGPPGCGKTVVALYRAKMIAEQKRRAQMITYSSVLAGYIKSGSAVEAVPLDALTYHRWVSEIYDKLYHLYVPKLTGYKNKYKFNWQKIMTKLNCDPPPEDLLPYVIVDEGQDMPKEFYLVASTLSKNLTVFIDENQRITEDQCTYEDVLACSGIPKQNVHSLRKNYRNTKQIATLAACFYTGTRSGIPEIPARSGPPIVLKKQSLIYESVLQIRLFHEQNPRAEIGVLLPKVEQVKEFVRQLKRYLKDPSVLHWYYRENDQKIGKPRFDSPGINVLTHQSAKGLEFDAVFLPELHDLWETDPTDASFRMKFYVLTSRARERLFLFYRKARTPIVAYIEQCLNESGLSEDDIEIAL